MFPVFEHVRFKCSIMVNLFENLLSARAVIDSLSSIVSIDHFKTGMVSKFIPKNVNLKIIFQNFGKHNFQKFGEKIFFDNFHKKKHFFGDEFWNQPQFRIRQPRTKRDFQISDLKMWQILAVRMVRWHIGPEMIYFCGTVRTFYRTLSGFLGFIGHRRGIWQVVYCFSLLSSWYVILKQ